MIAALEHRNAAQMPSSEDLPVALVSDAIDLTTALAADIDAAILNRSMPQTVGQWLDAMAPEQLPAGRYVLPAERVSACLADLFHERGHNGPELAWLCADAQELAVQIHRLTDAPRLRLRLEPVFDNACSKMHIDNVVARLICTYSGPGTELGTAATANEPLMTVPTGAPILLKGRRWPAATEPALRHKSPAIKGTGLSRLVMVLEGCPDADIIPDYDQLY